MFTIYQDYVFQKSIDLIKENDFTKKKKKRKAKSRWHPSETITDADYADDLALLENTPAQAESLGQAARGLYVNANKTEYIFKRKGDISTLRGKPLKSVDKFEYLGSIISSTERDVHIGLAEAWTAIHRISIIWKSNLSDKMKQDYSKLWLC